VTSVVPLPVSAVEAPPAVGLTVQVPRLKVATTVPPSAANRPVTE